MVNTLSELGHNGKCFLAVYGDNVADDGQKMAVTFQLFCGFEAHSLSYIKKELQGGLIHARLARIKALATAGVGKSLLPSVKECLRWTVGKKRLSRRLARIRILPRYKSNRLPSSAGAAINALVDVNQRTFRKPSTPRGAKAVS